MIDPTTLRQRDEDRDSLTHHTRAASPNWSYQLAAALDDILFDLDPDEDSPNCASARHCLACFRRWQAESKGQHALPLDTEQAI
jgi:hypothetical protein